MTDWTETFYGNTARLLYGINALDGLRLLETASVQSIVTSPPYWGLRNYNTNPQIWPSSSGLPPFTGESEGGLCNHQWTTTNPRRRRSSNDVVNPDSKQATSVGTLHDLVPANICSLCGCWQGELGQEPTPELFIEHLVLIFRECRRVLRNDGTLWINIGDTYQDRVLQLIPARLALALGEDGWIRRDEIVWSKPNCMPESVNNRCTRSHEMIYMLTRHRSDYYYDHEAVKTPGKDPEDDLRRISQARKDDKRSSDSDNVARIRKSEKQRGHSHRHNGFNDRWDDMTKEEQQAMGANLRSVWWITPSQYRESHYATFPPTLPETCLLAGTSEGGCCPKCRKPWERVVETQRKFESGSGKSGNDPAGKHPDGLQGGGATGDIRRGPTLSTFTKGFEPACTCNAGDPIPCTVLDPFMGSGTTAAVALTNNRHVIGIDLDPKNLDMAIRRIKKAAARSERTIRLI